MAKVLIKEPKVCGECGVFCPLGLQEEAKLKNGQNAKGQCRFYAPSSNSYPVFPLVLSKDVACGQARPKYAA